MASRCDRCQRELLHHGSPCAACAGDIDALFGPVPPRFSARDSAYRKPAPPEEKRDTPDPDWLRAPEGQRRAALPANLITGAAMLALGLGLTLLSYVGALGRGGGARYTIFGGLIAVGAYRFFRGVLFRD